jgi:hypothetical protein
MISDEFPYWNIKGHLKKEEWYTNNFLKINHHNFDRIEMSQK